MMVRAKEEELQSLVESGNASGPSTNTDNQNNNMLSQGEKQDEKPPAL